MLATLLAAAPFLVFGVVQTARTASWVSQRVEAAGVVRETARDAESKRYYVVVDFTTAAGRDVTFGRWVDGPGVYRDGEPVRVMYREASPEFSARIVTSKGLWLEPALLLALGALPVVAGLTVFTITERRIAATARPATSVGGCSTRALP